MGQPDAAVTRGFCIVVPMFNEEANAHRCVTRIVDAIGRTRPPGRLIIVDDGSTDGTAKALDALRAACPGVIIVTHDVNRGYGCALMSGVAAAAALQAGYVLFMDADLTTDPKYIELFVERMYGDYDLIKATRYSHGGRMVGVPLHRVLISRAGNAFVRLVLGVQLTDSTNGFRAVKTHLFTGLSLRESGFAIIMEELAALSRRRVSCAEVPYVLTSRGPDEGVSRFVYRPAVFVSYLKYALSAAFNTRRAAARSEDSCSQ